MTEANRLEVFFHPRKVVLFGSSSRTLPVGMTKPVLYHRVKENVSTYPATLILDADKSGWESGLKGSNEDLVVIPTITKKFFSDLMTLISKGFKNFVILPGDFNPDEKENLRKLARETGIRVLGPNSIFGVIDTSSGLNTTFERGLSLKSGGSSFLFQSGGIGAAVLDQVILHRIGVRRMAFLGNRLTIDEFQMVESLFYDGETRSIGLYTEGMNLTEERISFLKSTLKRKPLVVLKGGRSEAGRKRALLHTDSLSSDDAVLLGILRGVGAIPVDSVELLTQQTHFLSLNPHPPANENVIIVSNVGGPAIELTDRLSSSGFNLLSLPDSVIDMIRRSTPGVEPLNPVDLIADAGYDRYKRVLEAILPEVKAGAVIVITALKSTLLSVEDVRRIIALVAGFPGEDVARIVYIPGVQDYLQVLSHLPDGEVESVFLHHSSCVIAEVLKNWQWLWRFRSSTV